MLTSEFPAPMPVLPEPGEYVYWRSRRHAYAIGYAQAFGPGPFRVFGTVDKSHLGIPAGVIVETRLGKREINEVWLAAEPR